MRQFSVAVPVFFMGGGDFFFFAEKFHSVLSEISHFCIGMLEMLLYIWVISCVSLNTLECMDASSRNDETMMNKFFIQDVVTNILSDKKYKFQTFSLI